MPDAIERKQATVHGYADTPASATVEIVAYDRGRRVRRAVAGLALCWGAATLSIPIIIAHLILVPGFFLGGIYLFIRRLKTEQAVRGIHGTCPDCHTEQDFEVPGRWSEQMEVACGHCHRSLRIDVS